MNTIDLNKYLIKQLTVHLQLPEYYNEDLVKLNLPYLFAKDNDSAITWLTRIEKEFNIEIPDNDADLFFFSSIEQMVDVITKLGSKNK